MTTLKVDFTRLPFPDGILDPRGDYAYAPAPPPGIIPPGQAFAFPVEPCVGYSPANKVDLARIYADQKDSQKLLFVSTAHSTNNKIYFDDGLIIETHRSPLSQSNFGEGLGIVFDVSQPAAMSSIRVQVEFDYLAVSTAEFFDPRSIVKSPVAEGSDVPSDRPSGLGFAIGRLVQFIKNPRTWIGDFTGVVAGKTPPFFGTLSAFCTAEDLTEKSLDISSDQMASALVQISYDPDPPALRTTEGIRIAVPGRVGTPAKNNSDTTDTWDFHFFVERFRCPIRKVSSWFYNFFKEPWSGNPRFSYVFQFVMEESGKNNPNDDAAIGMRLLYSADGSGGVFDELNRDGMLEYSVADGPPDTSRFSSNHFTNALFSSIRFAGISLEIGKPKTANPSPHSGPSRVRIKSLSVDWS